MSTFFITLRITVKSNQTMGKVRPGNKQNAGLNGECVKHARDLKKATSGLRRAKSKIVIKEKLDDSVQEEEDDWNSTPEI